MGRTELKQHPLLAALMEIKKRTTEMVVIIINH